jgi:hypothetical protein
MATRCYGYLKARVMRATKLDADGTPVVGAKSTVVSGGFIRIALNMEYEDGAEYVQKNAWGEFCINEQDDDRLKRITPTLDFCQVDPDLVSMITGARLIMDGTDAVGFAVGEAAPTGRFALEAWSKVAGTSEYVYWNLPNLGAGRIGNITLEGATGTFSMSARSSGAPDGVWIAGTDAATDGLPYSQSYLPDDETIEEGEHIATNVTSVAPPTASCGAVAYAVPV